MGMHVHVTGLMGNDMKLSEVKLGGLARLIDVTGSADFVQRMHEIGLVPGAEVQIDQKLPMQGPLVIKYMTTRLAIRRADAENILVEMMEADAK